MANAKANFKKAVSKAKLLYKTGKYKRFSDAVKAAYKTIGSVKPKNANRQTGTSKKKIDATRKAKAPGKRVVKHAGAKSTVYYERRKNRSDKPGTLTGAKSVIKKIYKEKLSAALLKRALATTKTERKQAGKKVAEFRRELRKID